MDPKNAKVIHDCCEGLKFFKDNLCYLAESFHATGNTKMSKKLYGIADDVATMAEKIQETMSKDLDEQVKASNEAHRNMLKVVGIA